jgi:hypothetical protein
VKLYNDVIVNILTRYLLSMQSTGAFIAVSRYASATPIPPSVLSRGIGWQVRLLLLTSNA